ncbi:endonuclease/exonuclease/phosphatase family protein [Rubellimicrobium aerolatum]|uniref:Endonuclease/exonuclease/phosphatase family protein n=1 Tax=Rubellimicrobium aerolatum TaxID=490979 RepID=A0ABW0S9S6_9RHOB|nr:endonuclease/exonuclease/phosphatase family protein [Rubellimicrobium aerolatum]MBP1805009.1 exonuclease III [Rubellimicrobium aerolatum]
MKITTLNLWHGGSRRIDALAEWLVGTGSDAIICSEVHRGPTGDRLRARLAEAGYRRCFVPEVPPKTNTVALFAREEAEAVPLALPEGEEHRAVAARVAGVTLVGVYFAQLKAKRPMFLWLLGRPPELSGPTLVMGDFNTGRHRLDEAGATFQCAAEFGRLGEAGWVDAWRLLHGEAREFSWYSTAGNGFRLDHAFVSADLVERVSAADYDHSTRAGLSDHSALRLDLRSTA